jgi:uncharacterized protein YcfL
MQTLKLCLVLSYLLTGCVSQRYVGVQITSTVPMNITRAQVDVRAVVVRRVMNKRPAWDTAGSWFV